MAAHNFIGSAAGSSTAQILGSMAAHNFIGSAAGSSTASALWFVNGGQGFVSAQGNWKLVISLNEYSLERYYSGGFTEIAGGPLSLADARALWVGMLSPTAEGGSSTSGIAFDGGEWKLLFVSAGVYNLQRFYSAAFHTLTGGTITAAQLNELRDLLDLLVS